MYNKIGLIGLGLIGGSVAKSIKSKHNNIEIIAIDNSETSIETAFNEGIISNDKTFPISKLAECDLIFLCTPVAVNISYLTKLKPIISPNTIISDVGSVKGEMEQAVSDIGLSSQFIGAHPMCGSEKTGYENSSDHLFENAYFLITDNKVVDRDKIDEFKEFIRSIGALPLLTTSDEHDYITGGISHIPHIISAGLVNFVMNNDNSSHTMRTVAAGGFRDITRISSASPVMWQNICLTNKDKILELLDKYIVELKKFGAAITDGDSNEILNLFEEAKEYRDSLSIGKGLINKVHEFYCDIFDEAGAIANVATLLAVNNLNIKNIGIVHNREFRNGVLRIEMYKEEDKNAAISLLENRHYTVYQ
ncbi:MAG: prephenate dehydrogenase/arogenate dehydrogenase family protein [Lachnospiraceae bacterium]|nr:prephenate dehydrogenase/arogenate dehydrogenase family protein [Lachnospiraceae bacterium]